MIARTHRFHGHNSLRHVYQIGKTTRVSMLALKNAPNNRDAYRAAVVISRKVHKSAVVRNRIRRRIYEILRIHQKDLLSHDLVITVFDAGLQNMPATELQQLVLTLLNRAHVLGAATITEK